MMRSARTWFKNTMTLEEMLVKKQSEQGKRESLGKNVSGAGERLAKSKLGVNTPEGHGGRGEGLRSRGGGGDWGRKVT